MDKQKLIEDVRAKLTALVVAIVSIVVFVGNIMPELGIPVVINMDVIEPFVGASAIIIAALLYGLGVRGTKFSSQAMGSGGERENLTESIRVKIVVLVEAVMAIVILFGGAFPNLGLPIVFDVATVEPFIYIVSVLFSAYVLSRSKDNMQ